MVNIQPLHYGKTSPGRSVVTKGKTSARYVRSSSKSSSRQPLCLRFHRVDGRMQIVMSETDGALLTEFSMLNTGESPNVVDASTLSSILEVNAPGKYYLSAKACKGILDRIEKRGKVIPPQLKDALERKAKESRLMT